MAVLDKSNKQEVEKYTDFVYNSPHRSFSQDIVWGDVKNDWNNEYVYLEKDNEIVAAMSILIRKIPGGFSLLYAPRGPVCDFNDSELVKELLEEVKPLAKKHKAFMLKMDPEIRFSEELDQIYRDNGFKVKNRDCSIEELIQPRNNMIVYFEDHDEESIMMKFSKRNRNYIRGSARKGVYTTWDTTDDYIKEFYELYIFMAKRNKISHRNLEYFMRMRDAFGDKLRIYLARHEDDILTGAITINYNGKLYYLYAGSNDTKRNFNPNQLMNYDMIKWGLEEGATQYDLGGVLEMDKNDGLFHFKKQFCDTDGVTEYIGEIDLVYNNFLYYLYNNVVPKLQKLKKKLTKK